DLSAIRNRRAGRQALQRVQMRRMRLCQSEEYLSEGNWNASESKRAGSKFLCSIVGVRITSSRPVSSGDPGDVIEATSIGGRRSDFFTAGKLAPGNFGLLQQYRHFSV